MLSVLNHLDLFAYLDSRSVGHFRRLCCRLLPTVALSPSSKRRYGQVEGEVGGDISSLSRAGLVHFLPFRSDAVVFVLVIAMMVAERLAGNSP